MAKEKKDTDPFNRLLEGSRKCVSKVDKKKLKELCKGQQPYAAVVACADSRVPVEQLFGANEAGSIFTIRIAGNVAADASVLGSVEYAVAHLHVPLLVVLGHTGCGAVMGAMKGGEHGHIEELLKHLEPACEECGGSAKKAVELNVRNQVRALLDSSPVVKAAHEAGKLELVGAVYSLETGKVERIF